MGLMDAADWQHAIFLNGWTRREATIPVIEKATGAILTHVGQASAADVDQAVRLAAEAQRAWAAKSYHERAAVMHRAADLFEQYAPELAQWAMQEAGANRMTGDRQGPAGAGECREAASLAAMPYGEVLRSMQPRLSFSRRLPVGVVGVIAPFNAPVVLAIRAVAPALALGNAVVLKPDPRTAVIGGAVFARIFEEAGLPANVLQVLPGGADVGAALVDHPKVPVIAFTGSTRAGRAIAAAAAHRLKRVHLELGGNSAFIVMDDVDIEWAAQLGARGTFTHAGQICMASGRHLVHESVAEAYAQALARIAGGMSVGDPTQGAEIGPIIDEGQRDQIDSLVRRSADAGAEVLTGGTHEGLLYRPTVLFPTPTDAPAYAEEVFGPVASIVPFATDDEAAALAADSEYGLSLGILTTDVTRALALAERIPSGAVHINDQTINDEPNVPFGGVGDSGNGARHGGHHANLEAFTELQWVTVRPPNGR
ncbi:aldehyde dehydrogenase family protein [Ammonicoccus fulvus]|uniref:Aldehyde dehydrogenase family protein n=1 Tax=Ammonicoccus fulvus TaxID=3138240 RepID=A0ABZ3FMM6_9ACTN